MKLSKLFQVLSLALLFSLIGWCGSSAHAAETTPDGKGKWDDHRGVHIITIQNRTQWRVDFYQDGNYKGTMSPWGDLTYQHNATRNVKFYARASFNDGSYYYWGPWERDINTNLTWQLDSSWQREYQPPRYANVYVQNRTGWPMDIYIDGHYQGTVAAYAWATYRIQQGRTKLYSRVTFNDGSYYYWGPYDIDLDANGYTWRIDR